MSEAKPTPKAAKPAQKLLVAVLVRGTISVRKDIKDTLTLLRLGRKHMCAIIADNESSRGMCKKAQGYIAWGEADSKLVAELTKSRGDGTVFHLSPPRKGFPRKGIKAGFTSGGALGYWGTKINDLITRMI